MDIKALGSNLARIRELAGLSQDALALEAGVARNAISSLEKGKGNPTIETLNALAAALGTPLVSFFGVDEGGLMPAEFLTNKSVGALKQLTKAKRNRSDAQMLNARGKRMDPPSEPLVEIEELHAGLEFVQRFAGQGRDIQLTAMALVFERPEYLRQLSSEFRGRLAQLLLAVKI